MVDYSRAAHQQLCPQPGHSIHEGPRNLKDLPGKLAGGAHHHRPHLQEAKINMDQLALTPAALAEMIALIEDDTISGKIAKEALPELLQVRGSPGGGGGVRAALGAGAEPRPPALTAVPAAPRRARATAASRRLWSRRAWCRSPT